MGLYFAGFLALLFALLVLIVFRRIEHFIPTQQYGQLVVSFPRSNHLSEEELRKLIDEHEFRCFDISYCLENEGRLIQYEMTINTTHQKNYRRLSETLTGLDIVQDFSLRPSG